MLDQCKESFGSGRVEALWEAIYLCAEQQAVMPEWVADEVIAIEAQSRNGNLRSFDQVLGYRRPNTKTVAAATKRKKHLDVVLHKLTLAVRGGEAISSDLFDEIGKEVGVSRRTVEGIYGEAKAIGYEFYGKPLSLGEITGHLSGETRIRRRRGRSIF